MPKITDARRRTASHTTFKHKCPDCDRHFACPHNVEQHRREKHTGERPYACTYCGSDFTRPYTRNRHIQIVHNKKVGPGRGKTTRNCDNPGFAAGETLPVSPGQDHGRLDQTAALPYTVPAGPTMASNPSTMTSTQSTRALAAPSTRSISSKTTSLPSTEAPRRSIRFTKEATAPRKSLEIARPIPFRCIRCKTTFMTEELMLEHMHDIHAEPASRGCSCKTCMASFPKMPSKTLFPPSKTLVLPSKRLLPQSRSNAQNEASSSSTEAAIDPILLDLPAGAAPAPAQQLTSTFDSIDPNALQSSAVTQGDVPIISTDMAIDPFAGLTADGTMAAITTSTAKPTSQSAPWNFNDEFELTDMFEPSFNGFEATDMPMHDAEGTVLELCSPLADLQPSYASPPVSNGPYFTLDASTTADQLFPRARESKGDEEAAGADSLSWDEILG